MKAVVKMTIISMLLIYVGLSNAAVTRSGDLMLDVAMGHRGSEVLPWATHGSENRSWNLNVI